MKSYYSDALVTIYNSSFNVLKSDVVVLDPPGPLVNANIFEAKTHYIFCGKQFEFYEKQFGGKRTVKVLWHFTVPDSDGLVKRVFSDIVLVVGNVLVPGEGLYPMQPIQNRANRWERPLELLLNLLGSSEGDILDPFMGSGNTLVAAKMMGRKAVGFDISPEMCRIAKERCNKI